MIVVDLSVQTLILKTQLLLLSKGITGVFLPVLFDGEGDIYGLCRQQLHAE